MMTLESSFTQVTHISMPSGSTLLSRTPSSVLVTVLAIKAVTSVTAAILILLEIPTTYCNKQQNNIDKTELKTLSYLYIII